MFFDYKCKVLKPRPDRTVRPEKSRTVYFCDSLSLKNRSMKKTGTCVNHGRTSRSDLTVLRIVMRSLLTVPYFPLNLNHIKKNKK